MATRNTTCRLAGSTARRAVLVFSITFGTMSFAPVAAPAEVTLVDVIKNLKQHEQRYENLEIVIQETYDIGDRKPGRLVFSGKGVSETVRKKSRTRCVSQGEWFRIDRKGSSETAEATFSLDRFRAFDGEKTRLFEQNAIAKTFDRRLEDSTFIRPHTLPIRYMDLPVPLSVFFGGNEAIQNHPPAQWNDRLTLDVTYEGEDTLGDLTCRRVFVNVRTNSGHVTTRSEFWLAEDRNYLPIKKLVFKPSFSKAIPSQESIMSDLREIKPGIWMPFDTTIKSFDKFALRANGVQKLRWKQRNVVERAQLDPKYDREFFSKRELPDGNMP